MSIVQQRPEAIAETSRLLNKLAMRGGLPMVREKVRQPASHYKPMTDLELNLPPLPVDRRRIIAVACLMFGITLDELCGRQRLRPIVDARQYAAVRMRQELAMSTIRIGWALGGRDHSTICHLINIRAKKP